MNGLPLNEGAMTDDNKLMGDSATEFLIYTGLAGESRFIDEMPTSEHHV